MAASAPPRDDWRGIVGDDVDDVSPLVATELRRRSRRLLGSLLAPHRARLAVAGVLIVTRTGGTLVIPLLVGQAIDRGIRAGRPEVLAAFVTLIAAAALTSALGQYGFLRVSGRIGQDVLLDLRMRVFSHVQGLSLAFYERYTSGRIISRLTSDIDTLTDLLATGLTSLLTSTLSIFAIAVILVLLDFRLGAATLLAFPVVLGLTQWFRVNSSRAYRAVRQAIALVIVHYTESLSGIRAVHAYGREPRNQEIFENLNGRYREANAWSARLTATYGPGIVFLGQLTTLAVLAYGGWLVIHGSLTVGVLTAFILYVRQFFEPMQELSQFYTLFQAAAAALEKLSGVLAERPQVAAPDRPVPLAAPRGQVEMEAVTFGYLSDPVLRDVSLNIPAGQTVALVGETGAGKTTTARLIARFYDPDQGRIRLDGIDLRQLADEDLRQSIVMVTQESFLFSGSVAANIAFGRPEASRAEVEAAAMAVGADRFIKLLPEGYDTEVRRRGVRLSAGQRQLVAFARAFLAGPRVLILDEATSSLDLPSERLVQRALRSLLAGRTAIIIAHRLSTVEIADRIVVIARGRIEEDGSPEKLLHSGGRYGLLHRAWVESLA